MSTKKLSAMICTKCNQDLTEHSFLPGQEFCFRCIYKMKTAKKIVPPKLCRICNEKILIDKELKKRQRTVFCSEKCALKCQKSKNEKHWTRRVRAHFGFL